MKYYWKFALTLSFVVTIFLSIQWVPRAQEFLTHLETRLGQYYPAELVLTFKDGMVSTNVEEPYFIRGSEQNNVLVIDTKIPFTLEQFKAYDTPLWLTKSEIVVVKNKTGGVRMQPLNELPDGVLTRDTVVSWLTQIQGHMGFMPYVMVITLFLALLLLSALLLVYLLFAALLIWAMSALFKFSVAGYGASYRIGLHVITAPMIIYAFLMIVFGIFGLFRFDFTFFLLVGAALNLLAIRKLSQSS